MIDAIAGLPLAAAFFSKDEILASAWATPYFPTVSKVVWLLGTIAAFFTALYMYRLYYLTFYGTFRGTHEQEHHLHESPPLWPHDASRVRSGRNRWFGAVTPAPH